MVKELITGLLWAYTVSVGAWAYIEGKRIESQLVAYKDEPNDETKKEIEPHPLPLGQVPWEMRDGSGRIVMESEANNPNQTYLGGR